MSNKRKQIDKLDFIKIRNYYASKGTVNRVRRQLIEGEKKSANYISGKGLIYKTYKELQLNNKKKTTYFKNGRKI